MIDVLHERLSRAAITTQGNECALSYIDLGDGPPLLLIHGGHGGWYHWVSNIEALSTHSRVIAPDLPGFGKSTKPQSDFTLKLAASELFAFLDRLGVVTFDIAAFSFGACVAAQMAVQAPHRVRSLAMVNPAGMGPVSRRLDGIQNAAAQAAKSHGLEQGVRISLESIMVSDARLVTEELCVIAANHVRATRVQTRPIARTHPTRALLERVRAPMWLVLGSQDPHQQYELDLRSNFVRAISEGNTASIAHTAHWLQFEAAPWFNDSLSTFIDRVRSKRVTPRTIDTGCPT
ncbi:alpha/beta fold hydrolase [Paraburkholderia antibiotica]|uniref:Alpha/beta fold hydrolase n=1 Tax=Paraburkholderia antibiotica TaxID=2728839 RepID=A0A7X9X5D9_9BURK|nr:alpha/beta fold hydrolase [Paraburkholderia antibiotica]NML31769.1 alpha/beta fold hydrolase [Paraburkholderia antibiotica]